MPSIYMSGAMSEGAGRELHVRDALVVWLDERALYNLIIMLIGVECGAKECGANFHPVILTRACARQQHCIPIEKH